MDYRRVISSHYVGQLLDCSLSDFKFRCCKKLEGLGDVAMTSRQHDVAIVQYSAMLSLNPANLQALFVKRSKARANMGLWVDALDDANQVHRSCPTPGFPY